MDDKEVKLNELSQLLQQAGHAHHTAFIETDGDDPEWPLWYANYLQGNLNHELNSEFTVSELVYHLIRVTKQHGEKGSNQSWADFAANYFCEITGQ